MAEVNYASLQRQYGGRYVALQGDEVIADADTYDELADRLNKAKVDWDNLIIEYVEPANIVCVY